MPTVLRVPDTAPTGLMALVREFQNERPGNRTKRTMQMYAEGVKGYLTSLENALGRPPELDDLTAESVEEYAYDQIRAGYAVATANLAVRGVRLWSLWLFQTGRGPDFAAIVRPLNPFKMPSRADGPGVVRILLAGSWPEVPSPR